MAPIKKKTPTKKREKKVMDIGSKISVLDSLKKGEKISTLARKFGVNESTIRSIRDNEPKIRQSATQLGARPEEEDEDVFEPSPLSDKSIVKIIKTIQEAVEEAIEHDPILMRSLKFKHDCNIALSCYQELYKDIVRRAKQPLLTKYFNKV